MLTGVLQPDCNSWPCAGMFAADDWTCPGCGNVNWARRPSCNKCSTSKPGTVDTNREGHGGGFKVAAAAAAASVAHDCACGP